MEALTLDLRYNNNMDDSFNLPSPTGCSSSTSASFSSASSSHQPFTPTSGRATPSSFSPIDFSPSYSSTTYRPCASPFDLSPTPSALTGGYFGCDIKPGLVSPGIYHQHQPAHFGHTLPVHHMPPLTPVRRRHSMLDEVEVDFDRMLDVTLVAQSPLRDLSPEGINTRGAWVAAASHGSVHSSPFEIPTPAHSLAGSSSSWGMHHHAINGLPMGGSPLNYDDFVSPFEHSGSQEATPRQLEDAVSPSPERAMASLRVKRKLFVGQAQRRTTMLQNAQHQQNQHQHHQHQQQQQQQQQQSQQSQSREQAFFRPPFDAEDGSEHDVDGHLTHGGMEFKVIPRSGFRCAMPGCHKSYKRNEHLKRHIKNEHYSSNAECIVCEFCGHWFNRKDNYKSHLELHAKFRNRSRVKYFSEAQVVLDNLVRSMKGRSGTRRPAKKEKARRATTTSRAGSSE